MLNDPIIVLMVIFIIAGGISIIGSLVKKYKKNNDHCHHTH